MQVISKEEFESRKEDVLEAIKAGAVFIYGTDTIYGIGCDATNDEAVKKIRKLKQRPSSPFSVIAPSKSWIVENCDGFGLYDELGKLPGPYTFILSLKNKSCVSGQVNPESPTLGVRMPEHWFADFIGELGLPIITTSVNKKDEPYMTSLDDIDLDIKAHVDFAIIEGEIKGSPSTLINLTKENKQITER
ncbi:threonylcarbamoyl-AMP synthase [Candidatus Woesearchaeota archaeon]|nr:threonylcarbamoyl-AMP synthase [Candidatus Woesearchaeota archaeon]MBW3016774.1 threonylcarbamoyl-AMP synthase [Candidatus Woesearchaeota archaeon]